MSENNDTTLQQLVLARLAERGWKVDELVPCATRRFGTVTTPNVAAIWVSSREEGVRLGCEYWSEGRNILVDIDAFLAHEQTAMVDNMLDRLLQEIQGAVDNSYARRLLLSRTTTPAPAP